MVLSDEFKEVLELIENQHLNVFVTGRAGTGKSTLLQTLKKVSKKRMVVLAPTGIAALNVRGQTIHSFFRFPPKMIAQQDIKKLKNHKLYKKLELLVIDEISMVRADTLDNIDLFLRRNREINLPFGGVQLVVFGDLFQLPPVVANNIEREILTQRYKSPYFFSSRVLKRDLDLQMIELQKVYRQEERRFINLLDSIRLKELDYDMFEDLNDRYIPDFESDEFYITLCSLNKTVKEINEEKLLNLEGEEFEYSAKVSGDFNPNQFPTDFNLKLKVGAQVMFIKNDPEKKYVNGTIAIIESLSYDSIKVRMEDENGKHQYLDIEQQEWEILKYELDDKDQSKFRSKIVGSFTQYPIKLAWAITIHKSQGKTFEKIIIDLGKGAFEYGQTYVALSRCKTLDGIVLKQPLRPNDIKIDDRVLAYYEYKRNYW